MLSSELRFLGFLSYNPSSLYQHDSRWRTVKGYLEVKIKEPGSGIGLPWLNGSAAYSWICLDKTFKFSVPQFSYL
jgi:hypothetical protein